MSHASMAGEACCGYIVKFVNIKRPSIAFRRIDMLGTFLILRVVQYQICHTLVALCDVVLTHLVQPADYVHHIYSGEE